MNSRSLRQARADKKAREEDTVGEIFMSNISNTINRSEVQNAVAFIKHTNGEMYYVTSDGESDEIIGMIEVGKATLVNQRFEDEE